MVSCSKIETKSPFFSVVRARQLLRHPGSRGFRCGLSGDQKVPLTFSQVKDSLALEIQLSEVYCESAVEVLFSEVCNGSFVSVADTFRECGSLLPLSCDSMDNYWELHPSKPILCLPGITSVHMFEHQHYLGSPALLLSS